MDCNPAQVAAGRFDQIGGRQKGVTGDRRKLCSLSVIFAEPLTDLVSQCASEIEVIEDRG